MSCEWLDTFDDNRCTVTDLPCTVADGETCDLAYAIEDKMAEYRDS